MTFILRWAVNRLLLPLTDFRPRTPNFPIADKPTKTTCADRFGV
jgi:hypothetical protein